MNLLNENIKQLASKKAEENGFFLIDCVIRGNNANRIIEIYVDGEKNVSADDCAKISYDINSLLEDNPEIGSSYRLDVSSPGVDRPLKFIKQYPKHINRYFEIIYKKGDEEKKMTAKLVRIEEDDLIFLFNKDEVIINFNNIKKAKVLVSFS
jgi:ribosome maturation factor RimP